MCAMQLLVADSAYPLLLWLLKPFVNHGSLTQDQKNFNYHLSCARIVSENAFGRLKVKWRRLIRQNDVEVASVPNVVVACCILHNICEIHCEEFDNAWLYKKVHNSPRDCNLLLLYLIKVEVKLILKKFEIH